MVIAALNTAEERSYLLYKLFMTVFVEFQSDTKL